MRVSFGPIILIVAGVLLLLANLDLIEMGQLRAILKQWWPALLIVAGVLQLRKN